MADHRRDDAAAREVDEVPQGAEHRRDDHHAPALDVMHEAEEQAEADDADDGAAQTLLEAVEG